MRKISLSLIFPMILFSLLLFQFLGAIPYRDGAIEFIQSYNVYHGGLQEYMNHWGSVHPPMKYFLLTILYHIFGPNNVSYTLLGLILGNISLASLYLLTKYLFNKSVAYHAALFLAISPLFISVGIFGMLDFVVTCFLLLSLLLYVKQKYVFYAITASLLVLSKETGLVLPGVIILVETYFTVYSFVKKQQISIKPFLYEIIPFITFGCWYLFLQLNHQKSWQDYIYSPVANHGSFYVIVYNLLTGQFLNQYAYQHWLQVFFLNFNWVYWLVIFCTGIIFLCIEKFRPIQKLPRVTKKSLVIIVFFCITYLITVLALQTFTIPRYELPIYPFLYVGLAVAITWLKTKKQIIGSFVHICVAIFLIISLFTSIDPLSKALWGTTTVQNQTLYALNQHLSGNDGITYNIQYLFLVKQRTQTLMVLENTPTLLTSFNCSFLFHDTQNDKEVLAILHLSQVPVDIKCHDFSE